MHVYGIWAFQTKSCSSSVVKLRQENTVNMKSVCLKTSRSSSSIMSVSVEYKWRVVYHITLTQASGLVISQEHTCRVIISWRKKKPGVKVRSLPSSRGQSQQSCPQSSDRRAYETRLGEGGKKAQLPANCNSSPFIILSAQWKNTRHLWSKARQSGIVFSDLNACKGQTQATVTAEEKEIFWKTSNCFEVIRK